MGRYITLSGILHALVVLIFTIPVYLWAPESMEPVTVIPISSTPPPQVEPEDLEDPPTPTPVPTPDLTKARSIVGREAPTPTPSPTPSPTSTKKPSPSPTPTATQEKPTATPTASQKPPTNTPTAKSTNTAAPTKTAAPTSTPKATSSPTPDKRKTEIQRQIEALQTEMADPDKPTPIAPQKVSTDSSNFINQGGGISTSVAFGDQGYLSRLSSALQRNFIPPKVPEGSGDMVAKVRFKISMDGTISDWRVETSSGHKRVDSAAIRAIQAIERFERLPHGTPDLEVTCDFKVE